jgi:hypothetical protein
MPTSLTLPPMLHASAAAAVAALEAVGARRQEALDLVTEVPGVGRFERRFGLLGPPGGAPPVDDAILGAFRDVIARPENAGVAARLAAGELTYCPGSKNLLLRLRPLLFARGLHAPWTLRPMNMDFMSAASKANRARPFGFRTFYSEQVQITPDREVRVRQLFSFPLSGSPDQTLLEPDRDDELDAAVGVFLEADVLVG